MTARPTFEYELEQVNVELIKMGALVEQAIDNAISSFKNQNYELAREVVAKDRAIDEMEKHIESKCLTLILRQQPVARDLRVVSTALKMVTDLERIGDHASDIAELVINIRGEHIYDIIEHIPEMATVSKKMVHDAIRAFVNGDVEESKEVAKRDDMVDDLFDKVKMEVIERLKASSDNSDMCVDFLMIGKYLERIGDHAENICEWVEFNETGEYKNQRLL